MQHLLMQPYRATQTGLLAFGRRLEELVVIVLELGQQVVWEELPRVLKAKRLRNLGTVRVEGEAW